jgi:hypothetical protein
VTALLRGGAALLAIGFAACLVLGSAWPWSLASSDSGLIRLSWRAVGRRVEACREPSAEELAALPAHMRQTSICEARLAPFRLSVKIDGEAVRDRLIEPSGARGDRPAYVHEEFPASPGEHRLWVRFTAELPAGAPAEPPETLDATARVEAGRIVLVTRSDAGLHLLRE